MQGEYLHIPQVRCEEVRDTVTSLRLDAVASTGFRMARGKAAELIASGRVQVNWRECTKPDQLLAEGDTVSARGFGKFELAEVGGMTKKGRISIVVKRYI
ncbi:MAG: S4 domain-containing protein [Dysosmobacter sp.]